MHRTVFLPVNNLQGKSQDQAMEEYIMKVEEMREQYA